MTGDVTLVVSGAPRSAATRGRVEVEPERARFIARAPAPVQAGDLVAVVPTVAIAPPARITVSTAAHRAPAEVAATIRRDAAARL